jgi:hypothetical protein
LQSVVPFGGLATAAAQKPAAICATTRVHDAWRFNQRMRGAPLGCTPAGGRRKFVGWDDDDLDLGLRGAGLMAIWTLKKVGDRIARNQGGSRPFHVDKAIRADGRLQLLERPPNPVNHGSLRRLPRPAVFSLHRTIAKLEIGKNDGPAWNGHSCRGAKQSPSSAGNVNELGPCCLLAFSGNRQGGKTRQWAESSCVSVCTKELTRGQRHNNQGVQTPRLGPACTEAVPC